MARLPLYEKAEDYEAFEQVLAEAYELIPLPIFAYAMLPFHWHYVVRPTIQNQLSEFFR